MEALDIEGPPFSKKKKVRFAGFFGFGFVFAQFAFSQRERERKMR